VIHVYTGTGKGKTTAAFGLAMRAAGQGLPVRVIQFMKGNYFTGELASAARLGIEVFQCGEKCPRATEIKNGLSRCDGCGNCWIKKRGVTVLDRENFTRAWQLARDTVTRGRHEMLILDEIINGISYGLIDQGELLSWLDNLSPEPEIVLTGREAPRKLQEKADLVSEINKLKHYFDGGIKARRGIEY